MCFDRASAARCHSLAADWGRHQPGRCTRSNDVMVQWQADLCTYRNIPSTADGRGRSPDSRSTRDVPTLQWMEILRFVTLIQGFLAEMRGIFACRNLRQKGGVAGWQN